MAILSKTAPASPSRIPGKVAVVRGMVTGLLEGTWKGGDRLTEAEAVERFGVSRTPVREALLELAGLGLVELRRNCGAVFAPFGPQEVKDLYAVRTLLEVEAARLAATRLDRDWLFQSLAAFERMREQNAADAGWREDRKLHAAIADASGNRRLAAEIGRYGDIVQLMREIVGARTLGDIHSTTVNEHLAILHAIQRREPEAAAAAMRNHLEQAAESASLAAEARRRKISG
ncbi:MAG: GntR family transcriptional regulator [Verrucomicrobiae bacterium]|nr:GntR family transcriptional regulator [Verrucomicrobiae bacterium]